MREIGIIGSDPEHFACPRCGSTDRERHLLAYLRETRLLDEMRGKSLLQFAPERRLTPVLQGLGLSRHVMADLFPSGPGIERMDMLQIPYADRTFDFVMANHVLEHVADDLKALAELHRVLRPGGRAILQTPYSEMLERTFSDPGIDTEGARLQLYGQEDHVRLYGRDIFERFASAGFEPRVKRHDDVLPNLDAVRFGMNRKEPFFLFQRR